MAKSDKEKNLIDHYERSIAQCLAGKGYVPLSRKDLIYYLRIPEHHEATAVKAIKNLVDQGVVVMRGRKYHLTESKADVVTGVMSMHHRGFGFLKPDNPSEVGEEIFIPKHATKNAVDGDRVEVVVDWANVSEKGPEGRIVAILQRGRSHVAGVVRDFDTHENYVVYCPILGLSHSVKVMRSENSSWVVGDRVVLKVVEWGNEDVDTVGEVVHHMGHISDPSIDVACAIEEFDLRGDFPTKVVKEAKSLGNRVTQSDMDGRTDYRETETVTIDPRTAKDFDDAISLKDLPNGGFELIVHIADVTHYVRQGSALDKEALSRCNSTYFPGICVPMLPGALSDNLCSLKPNVNRLAVSVKMQLNSKGEVREHQIIRSVIRSDKRFSYEDAKAILDGKRKSKHAPLLERMVRLCKVLKRRRFERESIEFALPEVSVVVDEKGVPTGFERTEYDITHQMIEEFMLMANEMVARHLTDRGKELPYRIHEEPASDNLAEFSLVAGLFGFKIPKKPTNRELQLFFEEISGTPFAQYLATQYIRCMKMAFYSPDNVGHYGLRLDHYCHFTSPIRRYADLTVHRILFGVDIQGEALKKVTDACSEQERLSAKAENSVRLLKKLRLLDQMMKDDAEVEFDALVTKVKPFGVVFEIPALMMEGFIHIARLGTDYYQYNEHSGSLEGSYGGKKFAPGMKIKVFCARRNLITLESDWELVKRREGESEGKGGKGGKGGSGGKSKSLREVMMREREREGSSKREGSKKEKGDEEDKKWSKNRGRRGKSRGKGKGKRKR